MKKINYKSEFHLDDPRRTIEHGEIIKNKPFLRRIYIDWYSEFIRCTNEIPDGKILEIGSGGGFLKELLPQVITSDVLELPNCDMTFSAEKLPFEKEELSAIFMINVLHHIPDPENFFNEANLKLIYKNFHHEAFDEKASWKLNSIGPLSSSNQALPSIIFERDRIVFNQKYPKLQILRLKYHTPFRYILSGGVSKKPLLPYFTYPIISKFEKLLQPINKLIGMFMTIEIEKK